MFSVAGRKDGEPLSVVTASTGVCHVRVTAHIFPRQKRVSEEERGNRLPIEQKSGRATGEELSAVKAKVFFAALARTVRCTLQSLITSA